MARSLGPEDEEAWARVVATVRPFAGRRAPIGPHALPGNPPPVPPAVAWRVTSPAPAIARDTLDGGWDRRLKRGAAVPDMVIDLHGHTLAGAHAALDAGLSRAIVADARLVLLVAGRMPSAGSRLDSPLRGIIRASIGDWLHHSRYAARIAAVRPAHPRHGGAGALYLVLRRRR